MKLEATDRKNPLLICVATIAAVVDNRLLVHFDNWDDTYDYWLVPSLRLSESYYPNTVSFPVCHISGASMLVCVASVW